MSRGGPLRVGTGCAAIAHGAALYFSGQVVRVPSLVSGPHDVEVPVRSRPRSVAVVVILGHPPKVDLVNDVADDVECVLGNWSRADELVLVEGPSSWEVVVDHLAHLGA